MKNCKIFPINFKYLLLISVFIFFSGQISVAQGANRLVINPVINKGTQMNDNTPLKSHEIRKGKIALSQDMLPKIAGAENRKAQVPPTKGDTLSVNLFDDVKYDVKVDSVEHHADGVLIVNGKLKNHKIKTFLMTIGSGGYLMSVKDMNKSRQYLVNGNSSDGSGTVTEIDMKKMPPLIR